MLFFLPCFPTFSVWLSSEFRIRARHLLPAGTPASNESLVLQGWGWDCGQRRVWYPWGQPANRRRRELVGKHEQQELYGNQA